LVEIVLEKLRPQVGDVLINANRNQEAYRRFGCLVVGDSLTGYQGPLAGFAAAMDAASSDWILTVPCDGPWVPPDLLRRLSEALVATGADIAVAHDGERLQPVYALLPVALRTSLLAFLEAGERKIDIWYGRHRMATADFSDCPDIFRNVNTPEQRERFAMEGLGP
jgi:molybdenum cofactor guanylyltransferase